MAWVTVAEAARRLRLSEPVVLRRIQVGDLSARQEMIGRDVVWMISFPDDKPKRVKITGFPPTSL